MTLGFRREVHTNGAPLGYNAASSGNSLPTFRETYHFHLKVSRILLLVLNLSDGTENPETSVGNYHFSLRYSPDECSSKIMIQQQYVLRQ